jgi:hypothetical protein
MTAMLGAFAWQGWAFLGAMIGLPIILASMLSRGK